MDSNAGALEPDNNAIIPLSEKISGYGSSYKLMKVLTYGNVAHSILCYLLLAPYLNDVEKISIDLALVD